MIQTLVALHLLSHIPETLRFEWLAQSMPNVEASQRNAVLESLRSAYPDAPQELNAVHALLESSECHLELIQAAVLELQALYDSRRTVWKRPFAGRGCDPCRVPCLYGHLLELGVSSFETRIWELVRVSGSRPDAMAELSQRLVNTLLPPAARIRFDNQMQADIAYCLASSLAGTAVSAETASTFTTLHSAFYANWGIKDARD